MALIDFPIIYVNDPFKGRPLFNGQVFVGIADLDPQIPANQLQLRIVQEDGTKVDVAQPFVLSAGGSPVYNGATVRLDVDGNYSLKILDKNNVQTYYIHNVFEGQPVTEADLINDLSQAYEFPDVASMIGPFPLTKSLHVAGENGLFTNYIVVNFASDVDLGGGLWAKKLNTIDSEKVNENSLYITSHKTASNERIANSGLSPEVIAHKGFAAQNPENTLLAMSTAAAQGASLECDVAISADATPYLFHDADMNPLTNMTGRFVDHINGAIDGAVFSALTPFWISDEPIPKFVDFLKLAKRSGAYIYPELKVLRDSPNDLVDIQNILQEIKEAQMVEMTTVQCTIAQANYIRDTLGNKEIRLAILGLFGPGWFDTIDNCVAIGNCDMYSSTASYDTDPSIVQYAADNNVSLIAFTIQSKDEARRMVDLGVRRLMSDISLGDTL